MRLFIGLGLPHDARDALQSAVSTLGLQGRETSSDNYHITLAFLGERTDSLTGIEDAMLAAARTCAPLQITIDGFGYFGRRDHALLFAKLQTAVSLNALADRVRMHLSKAGETYDNKAFAAHITLMRRANLTTLDLQALFTPIQLCADRLTLYHSAREQTVLRYRPVFEAKFGMDDYTI